MTDYYNPLVFNSSRRQDTSASPQRNQESSSTNPKILDTPTAPSSFYNPADQPTFPRQSTVPITSTFTLSAEPTQDEILSPAVHIRPSAATFPTRPSTAQDQHYPAWNSIETNTDDHAIHIKTRPYQDADEPRSPAVFERSSRTKSSSSRSSPSSLTESSTQTGSGSIAKKKKKAPLEQDGWREDADDDDEEYNEGRQKVTSSLLGVPTRTSRTPTARDTQPASSRRTARSAKKPPPEAVLEDSQREGWHPEEGEEEEEPKEEPKKKKKSTRRSRRPSTAPTRRSTVEQERESEGDGESMRESSFRGGSTWGSRTTPAPSQTVPLSLYDTIPSSSSLIRVQRMLPPSGKHPTKMNPMELYHSYTRNHWNPNPPIMHSSNHFYERKERGVLNRMPALAAPPFQPVDTVQEQLRKQRYRKSLRPNTYKPPTTKRRDDVIWENRIRNHQYSSWDHWSF